MEIKNNELEEMRQQLGILKEKIDGQKLINDNLIRQSMLNKMSFMKKYTWVSFFLLAYIYVAFFSLREQFNMSWLLYIATVIIMTVNVLFDAYINRFSKDQFLNNDLIATSKRMVRMKKLRKRSLLIGIIGMSIWSPWFFTELYYGASSSNGLVSPDYMWGTIVGGLVGLLAGACIGIWIYLRMQSINSDIIQQIDELTKETE